MEIVPQLVINSLIAGGIYALVALGFNLIFGAAKFFNFAHGAFSVVGAYAVFYFSKTLGLPVFAAVALGLAAAAGTGWLLDAAVFAPLRRRKASGMVTLVASLGAFTVIQALVAILFTSQFQTLGDSSAVQKIFTAASGSITLTQLIILACSLAVLAGLLPVLKLTLFGKAITALSDDEEVAKIVGIDTNTVIKKVFMIGAGIGGLAGILVGFDTGLEPTMGLQLLLKGVIAAIIGGAGSVPGAFLGAYLLGFAENFGIWQVSGEWKDAIAFGLLILFLLFRPSGIMKK